MSLDQNELHACRLCSGAGHLARHGARSDNPTGLTVCTECHGCGNSPCLVCGSVTGLRPSEEDGYNVCATCALACQPACGCGARPVIADLPGVGPVCDGCFALPITATRPGLLAARA